jgi:hypothetical protein
MPITRAHLVTVAAIGSAALGGAGLANAATKHATSQTTSTTSTGSTDAHRGNPNETALTGDTLKSASEAALAANSGATVEAATTEDPAENSGATYEVHITKADGTRANVLEDQDFKVLSTKTDQGHGGRGNHHGGPGANPNEKPLTGDDLAKAKAAAEAAQAGITVDNATTEDPAENTGAAYEVHAHKGTSFITITLDKDFKVVKTETNTRQHH